MKAKPLIILLIVVAVLVVLRVVQNASHRAEVEQTGLESLLADLPETEIGRLIFTGPAGEDVILARSGAEWVVESSFGHPANASSVDRITQSLSGLSGEFRSEKEEVLADYGLSDSLAIHLRVFNLAGEEQGHLLLGNPLSGSQGCFVRREGEQRAFATQGGLLSSLGIWGEQRDPEGKRFVDLKAFTLERQEVDSLLLRNGDDRMILAKIFTEPEADSIPVDREQYDWRVDGREAKKSSADGVLGALSSIYARNLLNPAADYAFEATNMSVDIVLQDGRRRLVEFGAEVTEPEEGVALRVAGQDFVYVVPKNLPERIFKSRDDLKPDEG